MACDASHLCEQVCVDLNRLHGHIKQDPAEYSAEEDLLRPGHLKKSEGAGEKGGSTSKQTTQPSGSSHLLPNSITL